MQRERHQRFLRSVLGLLVSEPHHAVLHVVLYVELTKRVGLDLDVEVLFNLDAALLQPHEAPLLQHPRIQQVPTDLGHYLETHVVSPVVTAPVDQLAIVLKIALECHVGRVGWTVQQLSDLLEGILQVEVHLIDATCHRW
jgi:hypothetical protein